MTRLHALFVGLVLTLPLVVATGGEVAAEPPPADTFHGFVPARLMDTRATGSTIDHLAEKGGSVGPNSVTNLIIAGRGEVPAIGVGAVALNVTGTGPSANTFLTVWPKGATQPDASNLNLRVGVTTPNMVIVPLSDDGQISIFNKNGNTDLLVDVLGWFPTGPSFSGLVPARLLDTRTSGVTVDHQFEKDGAVGPNSVTDLTILTRGGVPETGVGAVALNVTGTNPTANSFVTVWPKGAMQPDASNLNLRTGVTTPNMVIVPVGAGGQISLFNKNGNTDLLVNVLGWFPTGPSFTGLVPARLLDTRPSGQTIDHISEGEGKLQANSQYDLQVLFRGDVPDAGVGAVALNVTGTNPTANSFITVWPTGSARPNASNLNLQAGVTTPNMVIVPVGEDGYISIYNKNGATDVLVDVLGWFPETPSEPEMIRVSEADFDVEAIGGHTYSAAVSGDGRYTAFESTATNLVADDDNGWSDIFVYDRLGETTKRISVNSLGQQAETGDSIIPAISADGRWIAYQSAATDLVDSDLNGLTDIFLYDQLTETTERVNVGPGGVEAFALAGGNSELASVSADGRYVTFESSATNLVVGDTNGNTDVFVRDTQLGITTRISVSSSGVQSSGGGSHDPSISDDGRFIAYNSFATNLLGDGGDTNANWDTFLYDRTLGVTTRVSVDSAGNEVNFGGFHTEISGDGRFIVYDSSSDQVVPDDDNDAYDIFMYDRILATTTRVSLSTSGLESLSHEDSEFASISGNGRYVAYRSESSTFDAGDTNGTMDIYVWDRLTDETTWVSTNFTGGAPDDRSEIASISDDGKYIGFQSYTTDLIASDTNSLVNVFLRYMGTI